MEKEQHLPLSVAVIGASGHLSVHMVMPSLFQLYLRGMLPEAFQILGFARTPLSTEEFRSRLRPQLLKQQGQPPSSSPSPSSSSSSSLTQPNAVEDFLQHCTYLSGQYSSHRDFRKLGARFLDFEKSCPPPRRHNTYRWPSSSTAAGNRLLYFAIPPEQYGVVVRSLNRAHLLHPPNQALPDRGWTRLAVEKPFGSDSRSYGALAGVFRGARVGEEQIFRIDHYLGKETVLQILPLRFGNPALFERFWDHESIQNVQIWMNEVEGVANRGGFYDQAGVIRDVVQNHLLQILSLLAMEPPDPKRPLAESIPMAKAAVLRTIRPLRRRDVFLGQYHDYTEDPSVLDKTSRTATFAQLVFFVNTPRWKGVPFLIRSGKGLREKEAFVRISFRGPETGSQWSRQIIATDGSSSSSSTASRWRDSSRGERRRRNGVEAPPPMELIFRVQPDESVLIRNLAIQAPGVFSHELQAAPELRLPFRVGGRGLENQPVLPGAYERILWACLQGDHSSFVQSVELKESWRILTPLLREVDAGKVPVHRYERGSDGPEGAMEHARRFGISWSEPSTAQPPPPKMPSLQNRL